MSPFSLGILGSAYVAPAGGGGLTFHGTADSETDTTSYTFSDFDIGAASSSRVVFVAIAWNLSSVISSVTIGGVTATIDTQTSGACRTAIARAVVPTGTTATIVVTTNVTTLRLQVAVWSVSGVTVSLADTGIVDGSNLQAMSTTVTATAGGLIIAAHYPRGSLGSVTWTNATEDHDTQWGAGVTTSGASVASTTAGDLTITATYSTSANSGSLTVAAYSLT